MIIRKETEKDYFEVENLTREAFWNVYRPGCMEHFVLHNLRGDKCFVKDLDYVIEKALEKFDEKFPPKIKEVKEGQLV